MNYSFQRSSKNCTSASHPSSTIVQMRIPCPMCPYLSHLHVASCKRRRRLQTMLNSAMMSTIERMLMELYADVRRSSFLASAGVGVHLNVKVHNSSARGAPHGKSGQNRHETDHCRAAVVRKGLEICRIGKNEITRASVLVSSHPSVARDENRCHYRALTSNNSPKNFWGCLEKLAYYFAHSV